MTAPWRRWAGLIAWTCDHGQSAESRAVASSVKGPNGCSVSITRMGKKTGRHGGETCLCRRLCTCLRMSIHLAIHMSFYMPMHVSTTMSVRPDGNTDRQPIKGCAAVCIPVDDDLDALIRHDPQVLGHFALMKMLFVQNCFAIRQYDRMSAHLTPPARYACRYACICIHTCTHKWA